MSYCEVCSREITASESMCCNEINCPMEDVQDPFMDMYDEEFIEFSEDIESDMNFLLDD